MSPYNLLTPRYRDPPVAAEKKDKRLVIVESPAKARTIKGYLGDGFVVESSVGHIRDLPERAADIPEQYKKEKWARLGVDVEHDFQPKQAPEHSPVLQIRKEMVARHEV